MTHDEIIADFTSERIAHYVAVLHNIWKEDEQ